MVNIELKLKDWTKFPTGRYSGDFSGERYRKEVLAPKLQEAIDNNVKLVVNLDGVIGCPPSFLDEAFAGLVYASGFKKAVVKSKLLIVCKHSHYIEEIKEFIEEA